MSTTNNNRRLIEDWLPINATSVESIRERNAASALPPINWLHVWWARRPLAISRAAVAAALLNTDAAQEEFFNVIGTHPGVVDEQLRLDAAKIRGERLSQAYSMPRAFTHNLTDAEHKWFRENLAVPDPVVLDVTAGGGSIPFEIGRLGVQSIANELNPVATLILRATCEWPQRYGPALRDAYAEISSKYLARVRELIAENFVYPPEQQVHENEASNENPRTGAVRLHKCAQTYLWSRTVSCPDCGNFIPLSPNWRLDGNGTGIRVLPDEARGVCDFEVVNTAREQSKGTIVRGKAACPYPSCGATTATGYLADEAGAGRMGHQMYCVILKNQWQKADGEGGWVNIRKPKDQPATPPREFRAVRQEDDNSDDISALLDANKPRWDAENILPNEPVPAGNDPRPITYGMSPWREMFSPRQQLAHGYCVQAFRELVDTERDADRLDGRRKAAWSCIALALDKMLNRNSLLTRWDSGTNKVAGTFDSHDFGMKWSYAEMAVAIERLGLEWALDDMEQCISKLVEMAGWPPSDGAAAVTTPALLKTPETTGTIPTAPATKVINGDARMLDLDDASVDAVVFDPPTTTT